MTSGRRPYSDKADKAYKIIKETPGIHKSYLMLALGYKTTHGADALLPILEKSGYYVSESAEGCLFAWNIFESEKGDNARR